MCSNRLAGLAAGAGTSANDSAIRSEARGDILMAQGISITDISVVHPLSLNIISREATTAAAAASHRDQLKRTPYARVEPHGYAASYPSQWRRTVAPASRR
jgi:hypothetical protein